MSAEDTVSQEELSDGTRQPRKSAEGVDYRKLAGLKDGKKGKDKDKMADNRGKENVSANSEDGSGSEKPPCRAC